MKKKITCKVKLKALLCRIGICFLIVFSLSLTVSGQQITYQPITTEQIIQTINTEFSLTNQEQLILQPVINEITVYYKARSAIFWQRSDYVNSLKSKLNYFRRSMDRIVCHGLESIRKESHLRQNLYGIQQHYVKNRFFDPEAKEKSAFTRPWGWVKRKDLPGIKKEMERRNRELTDQWEKGDFFFPFTWPGFTMTTKNKLDEIIKTEKQKILKQSENLEKDSFSIHYPNMDWIKRKQLDDYIKIAKERLLKMRGQIKNGTLNMHSKDLKDRIFLVSPSRIKTDDLNGWVTQKQIQEKINELEKKKASVQYQYSKKALKIFRKHTGWTTESELKNSMAEILIKVKEVSDKIHKGSYNVYFPGSKKSFSRNSVDEEIKKTTDLIENIRTNKSYTVPVLEFRWSANRDDIEEALKRKELSNKQRLNLRKGLGRLGSVRALEINYHKANLAFLTAVRNKILGTTLRHAGPAYFNYYVTETALPFFFFHQWDFERRKRMIPPQFSIERNQYNIYYKLKIDHLKKCLKLF